MQTSTIIILLQFILLVVSLPSADTSTLVIHNNSTGTELIPFTDGFSPNSAISSSESANAPTIYWKCETTIASPHVTNIRASAQKLDDLPHDTWCYQENRLGSFCTKMSVTGDATIGICGDYTYGIACSKAAEAAFKIAEKCEWFGLAGGTIWWTWATHIKIIVY